MICPLLKALEKKLGLEHMLCIDYTTIFCEMFVHGSDDDDGNHVEPIDATEYHRLYANVETMSKNTTERPWNKGGLVAGATKHSKKTLQYTTIAALKAKDGLDLIGLYEWCGKNPKCVYHDWSTNTLKMNCGAHNLRQRLIERVDYDPELLGDLGAIPHL
jgi:hypothetical protein